ELRDGPVAVDGRVAESGDNAGLVEHRLPGGGLEGRLVDQGTEVVLVREAQRRVVLVDPVDEQLQRPPGVEARSAGVGVRCGFGPRRRVVNVGPFGSEEGEVAHRCVTRGWESPKKAVGGSGTHTNIFSRGRSPCASPFRVTRWLMIKRAPHVLIG